MKTEIERRFLIDSQKLPTLQKGRLITQGYLSRLETATSPLIRVRSEGKKAYLTIKIYQTELTKLEFEYPIPLLEANRLLENCLFSVQKIRYFMKIRQHLWTIDLYEGENFPLAVAEIELKNEMEKIDLPLWIKQEVSQDNRFHAYNLAVKPFSTWKKTATK